MAWFEVRNGHHCGTWRGRGRVWTTMADPVSGAVCWGRRGQAWMADFMVAPPFEIVSRGVLMGLAW